MLHIVKPDRKKPRKRYLLINPPIEEPYLARIKQDKQDDNSRYQGRIYTYPLPIGLLRIAGQLLADGNEIYFLDCFSALPTPYPSSRSRITPVEESEFMLTEKYRVKYMHLGLKYDEIRRILQDVTADEVFVGCTFTYHNEPAHKVIALCRETLGDTKITFGGIYPTLAPEVARQSQADDIFTGPFPGLKSQRLNYDFLGMPPNFILIKGTSGCPNQCAYCAVHLLEGNRFSHRDPEDVFKEIVAAHQRFGLSEIGMWDSNILMRYDDYLGVILKRLRDLGTPLRMSAPEGFDYRLLTREVARDLKAANFQKVALALENADTSYTKDTLNRSNNIHRMERTIDHLKAAGFADHQIQLFVIVGLPGQSLDNIMTSIHFAWERNCNVTLFPFTPIPGTPLYEQSPSSLKDQPLKALHPSLYCCADNAMRDMLIGLKPLGQLQAQQLLQRDHYGKVIEDPELLDRLSKTLSQ